MLVKKRKITHLPKPRDQHVYISMASKKYIVTLHTKPQELSPTAYLNIVNQKRNFMWEREWRHPSAKGDLEFNDKDVFIGICPHTKKFEFEELFDGIPFVDCRRNMKYYAKELVEAKKRYRNFKYSVV